MLKDFARVLARVQSDFGFYVGCLTDPAVALAGYTLSTAERETLLDPTKLSAALGEIAHGNGALGLIITFSGKHDWVNKTQPTNKRDIHRSKAELGAQLSREIETVRQAGTHEDRATATVRLLTLIE